MPLIPALDGDGNEVTIYVQGQGATNDFSGMIAATDESQEAAAANPNRGYLYFENQGAHTMALNDLGDATLPSAFLVAPGQSWPPPGYPIPITAINVSGTAGEAFLYREA